MPAKPTNADLQRQIYSLQTEYRAGQNELKSTIKEMSGKLDKALEHSAAHKARLDGQDKAIEENRKGLCEERQAREEQGRWGMGTLLGAGLAIILAVMAWLKELKGG